MLDFPGRPEKVQPETIDLIVAQVNDQVERQVRGGRYRVGV
jgi:hypothetical protein